MPNAVVAVGLLRHGRAGQQRCEDRGGANVPDSGHAVSPATMEPGQPVTPDDVPNSALCRLQAGVNFPRPHLEHLRELHPNPRLRLLLRRSQSARLSRLERTRRPPLIGIDAEPFDDVLT
jgi:hypothetical protein